MVVKAVNLVVALLLTFLPVSSPCSMSGSFVCSCHSQSVGGADSSDGAGSQSGHSCCRGYSEKEPKDTNEGETPENNGDRSPMCPNCDHELIKSLKATTPSGFEGIVSQDVFVPAYLLVPVPPMPFIYEIDAMASATKPPCAFEIPPPMSLVVVRTHRLLI